MPTRSRLGMFVTKPMASFLEYVPCGAKRVCIKEDKSICSLIHNATTYLGTRNKFIGLGLRNLRVRRVTSNRNSASEDTK